MEKSAMKNRRQNKRVSSDWETPERERLHSARKSSESFSDFESPLNSLRSPLRPESKRAYSEGKQRDRNLHQLRYRQGNTMPLKQKQVFSSEGSFEDGRSGESSQMDEHSSRNKEPVGLTSPRTYSGATDWASIVEEEERNEVHEKSFRKRLELGQQQRQARTQTKSQCEAEGEAEDGGDLDEVEHPSSFETDSKVLERREKQISYGVNTPEYQNYRKQVPLHKRTKFHPWTPEKKLKYSRRGWDTVIRIWRKQLHIWDPKPSQRKLCDPLPVDRTELKNCTDSSVAKEQESFLDTGDVLDDDMTTADVDTVAVGELPESDCECLELDISELDAGN